MRAIKTILAELLALFVDDGSLVVALAGWVVILLLGARAGGFGPATEAVLLVLGVVLVLVENVGRFAYGQRPGRRRRPL